MFDLNIRKKKQKLPSHLDAFVARVISFTADADLCDGEVLLLRFLIFRGCFPIKSSNNKEHYVNEDIKTLGFGQSKQFRVIGAEGEQLGLLNYNAAQKAAYDADLDLVLISPQADPPVCKIIDYGKFRFERDKREKEAKKKQQIADVKEIQLTLNIDTNDFNTKVNHARKFLDGGDKVKVVVRFRGRQMQHLDLTTDMAKELLGRFTEAVTDVGSMDKAPLLEGRTFTMFLAPLKASEKAARAKAAAEEAAKEQQ